MILAFGPTVLHVEWDERAALVMLASASGTTADALAWLAAHGARDAGVMPASDDCLVEYVAWDWQHHEPDEPCEECSALAVAMLARFDQERAVTTPDGILMLGDSP